MKRVGVIGGGQLAWMMADAAQALEIELAIQTPQVSDPAVKIAAHTVLGAIDDAAVTRKLAAHADVITFENEFIDLEALSELAKSGVRFYPQLETLAPLLDKFHQRSYLRDIGLPVPQFIALEANSANPLGFPAVLKARRHGYDGYGTFVVKDPAQLETVLQQHPQQSWLLEEFVPFDRELAIMVARSLTGEIITYPVVETQQDQDNQVCRRVYVTQEWSADVRQQAEAIARTLMDRLQVVGIFGIELFLTKDGKVLVNEIAPRTHNSGHFTLDACQTSQFEQQLRAVTGLPLGDPSLQCDAAVMVNLLGYETSQSDYLEKRQQLADLPNAQVWWYGKSSRPGRKLGHVTVLLTEKSPALQRDKLEAIAQSIESTWYP